MDVELFFNKLTFILDLGNILSEVVRVGGGLMHTMYKLSTNTGIYAVKLLNPNVMKRPEAIGNYIQADNLEEMMKYRDIPIIPSLIINQNKMQQVDGQYFYVYKWYDGKILSSSDITMLHCQKISKVLSQIHHIEMRKEKFKRNPINVNWEHYIKTAKEQNIVVYNLLSANKELLDKSQENGNLAILKLPEVVSICHNDMDSKNILWVGDDFRIIDLECLGYSNPYLELFELALCWSGYECHNIDFALFRTFLSTYFEKGPNPIINWNAVYDSNYGRLEWLEYNVKRALLIECDTVEEQKIGTDQVIETIKHVIYYDSIKDEILDCLTDLFLK